MVPVATVIEVDKDTIPQVIFNSKERQPIAVCAFSELNKDTIPLVIFNSKERQPIAVSGAAGLCSFQF